jgi:hypothetical protein
MASIVPMHPAVLANAEDERHAIAMPSTEAA